MRKFSPFGLAALLAVTFAGRPLAAQQPVTVSGRVTIEGGAPLAGASVNITQLGLGDYTDAEGRYRIQVPAARAQGTYTVQVRRLGYKATSASLTLAGASVEQDFVLAAAPTQLEAVVATALGIEKQKRSVGVAQQTISGADLTQTPTPNVVNALSGKVAGVKVIGSTNPGGSARIVIRGENSIGGNNQPLFIIDGIPVDNSQFVSTNQTRGYGGFDYGTPLQDLNDADIASISVLKGPAAAALYGSRAANGAIIITTKSGKGAQGGFQVSASSAVTFETISKLPDYQNKYGQGANGQFNWVDGTGAGTNDGEDASWGPMLSPDSMKVQWFSNGQPAPWIAHPNNVRDFFQTGRTLTNNFSASGASDRANFRLSLGTENSDGIVPTNTFRRLTASANGSALLRDKLTADASVQYINNSANNRPGTGYDEFNPMMGFVWFGRQVDTKQLQQLYRDSTLVASNVANGVNCCQVNWNYNYHNNPYWNLYSNHNGDERNHVIGSTSLTYKPLTWLSAKVATGIDFYRHKREFDVAPGWVGGFFDPYTNGDFSQGGFSNEAIWSAENNSEFLLSSITNPIKGLGLTVNLGGNRRYAATNQQWVGTDALVAPGVYNMSNAATVYTPYQYDRRRQVNSLYGSAQFAWNDYFFVDVTGRNDWSSTLPKGNNSYFYPSLSTSLVFSDLFPALTMGGRMDYGKLRFAIARVGSDADPYLITMTYPSNPAWTGIDGSSVPRFYVPNTLTNANLKPEQTDSWEVGTELSFFQSRLGLDATYYQKKTTNQILTASVSPASGFSAAAVNAGEMDNNGVELQLTATPVKLDNGLSWDVTANYAQNKNKLAALYGDLTTFQIGPKFFGTSIEARLGQPYGAIIGYKIRRDDQGRMILNARGLPMRSPSTQIIGNVQPKWTGGLNNTLHYRGLDLSVFLDARIGGQLWSATNRFGTYAGILESTLRGREVDQTHPGIHITGVKTNGTPVDTTVRAEDYFKTMDGIEENFVYDASFVKLREMRLGYDVPASLLGRFNVGYKVNVALVGRNLWTHSNAPNIDPETAFSSGNLQGIEFGQLPATRSIGFQVNVTP